MTDATTLLRCLPAEFAHDLGMTLLAGGILKVLPKPTFHSHGVQMACELPGIGKLNHCVGLAAGFDKNARCPEAFQDMGFSFIELGTVTPHPQAGNAKPRVFRDAGQRSIVNRMGFNSDGAAVVAARLKKHGWTNFHVPLGLNVGKSKDTPVSHAINDYITCLEHFQDLARYFVVNISSPNTPGLRELATPTFLSSLAISTGPLIEKTWVKLDPDQDKKSFQKLIEQIKKSGFQGVILSNTHRVEYPEPGGQSGHPLLSLSNAMLEWAWEVHGGTLPMIGSGGILSGVDAFHKIARGACAVQLYSALVYRGPGVVSRVYEELALELKLRGFSSMTDAVGTWYGG